MTLPASQRFIKIQGFPNSSLRTYEVDCRVTDVGVLPSSILNCDMDMEASVAKTTSFPATLTE